MRRQPIDNIKYDLILFDFDGTIAATDRGIKRCAKAALDYYGIEEKDESRLDYFIGPPLIDAFRKLYGVDEEKGRLLVDKYREVYSAGGLYECDLYPGIEEQLKLLRSEGRRLAVVSSKPGPFVKLLLERFGIMYYFDLISAPEIGHINPTKAELIQTALDHFGAEPGQAVMIGDRLYDIQGGKAVGTLTLGAAYGYGGEIELREYGADLIALQTNQIVELIRNYEKDD